jgi:RNA polymerase sigma-70 factor (sigma-E family)
VDDDGFRDFVHARLGQLSRVAYLLTGNHHAAEDLLQNVLVKLALKWKRVAASGVPDAYVRKIMYHEHVSSWRRSRHLRNEYATGEVPEPPGADETGATVHRMVLDQALERLTRKQRAVLVLRFYEDLSEIETAEALGVSVGTVKSQTSHALARLRTQAPELHELIRTTREVLA